PSLALQEGQRTTASSASAASITIPAPQGLHFQANCAGGGTSGAGLTARGGTTLGGFCRDRIGRRRGSALMMAGTWGTRGWSDIRWARGFSIVRPPVAT